MNQISTGMRDWSIRPDTARSASRRKVPSVLNQRRGKPSGRVYPMEAELKKTAAQKFPTTRIIFAKDSNYTFLGGPDGAVLIAPSELAVFVCLAKGRPGAYQNYEDIAETVWPDPDGMPDYWGDIVRIQIHHLRKKLKYVGSELSIATFRTRGYYLERSGAEVVQ